MNAMRYSIGTSWFTRRGRSLRKILPTTSTRLSTATAKRTLTSNSRLRNRSISFIFRTEISTTQILLHNWINESSFRRSSIPWLRDEGRSEYGRVNGLRLLGGLRHHGQQYNLRVA